MAVAAPTARFHLSRTTRRWWLTAHIVFSVGLLGDSAGFLAVAVRGVTATDAGFSDVTWQLLEMFAFTFGIPLSVAALVTGVVLGWSSKWGVFRYPWVMIKLGLILSVMLVGTFVLPGLDALREGGPGLEARLIGGAAWDVVALTAATALAVFKPGRLRRGLRARADRQPVEAKDRP
ncbi:MAG TPA: hypothetical protein VFO17_03320 [Acidimicrobiia bacterium]|jgi:hypothetical protein|nr:hypothetical protein [Acidimicrobiia bacterium]